MKVGFEVGADINDAQNKFKQLKKDLAQLRDELKSIGTDIKIKVALDSAPVISQARQIRTNLQNAIGEVKVKLTVDAASVAADSARIKSQVQTAIGETRVKVKLDSAGLIPQLANLKTQINAYFAANTSAIRLSLSLAQADIAAIRARLTSLTGSSKIKLGIDLAHLNSQIAIARSMLASLVTGGVRISIDASATNLIAALNNLRVEIDRLRLALRNNPPNPPPGGGGGGGLGGLGGLTGQLAGVVAGLSSLAVIMGSLTKTVEVQRQFDVLNASLETATKSSENAAVAFDALSEFAAKTPYSLEQAVQGFVKLVNLGLTPSERALTSYGNTAASMGKDLMQFIEAVADASTSEFERLKEFGIKAKQEGDKVSLTFQGTTKTIGNNAQEIEEYLLALGENEFAGAMEKRANTLDGAIAALKDSWNLLFLEVSRSGVGAVIESGVRKANEEVEGFTNVLKSGAIQTALRGISNAFSIFGNDAKSDMESIGSAFSFLGDHMVGVWRSTINELNEIGNAWTTARALIQKASLGVAAGVDIVSDPFNRKSTNQQKQDNYQSGLDAIDAEATGRINAISNAIAEGEKKLADFRAKMQADANKPKIDRLAEFKIPSSGQTPGAKDGKADAAAKKAADDAKREVEDLARAKFEHEQALLRIKLDNNQQEYEAYKISAEKYYQQRLTITHALAQNEIDELDKRHKNAKNESERQEIDTQILKIEEELKDTKALILAEHRDMQQGMRRESDQLNIDLARAEGKSYDARIAEIKLKYDALIQSLKQQGRDSDVAIVVKIKRQEEMQAKADDIGQRTNRIINDQRDKENVLNRAKDEDPFSTLTLDRAVNDTRQNAVNQLIPEKDNLKQLQDAGHDVTEQMQQLNASILELQQNVPTTFQQFSIGMKQAVGTALTSGLTDLFTSVADGSKSAGEAMEDFAKSFIKSIAQIIIQAMAAYAALLILNTIPGGAAVASALDIASAAGSAQKVTSGSNHTGGMAGGGPRRTLDASAYLGAPRYHVGGIAGLAPGEIPAVLMQGEEVLTPDDPRHVANGGGQMGASVKIINGVDESVIHDNMQSSNGEKVIMNIIGRNASTIKRLLG